MSPIEIGQEIRRLRRAHYLSQREVSERVGCCWSSVTKAEKGECPHIQRRILDYFTSAPKDASDRFACAEGRTVCYHECYRASECAISPASARRIDFSGSRIGGGPVNSKSDSSPLLMPVPYKLVQKFGVCAR